MADDQELDELNDVVTEKAPRRESVTERSARRAEAKARAAVKIKANARAAQKAKAKALPAGSTADATIAKAAKRYEDASTARAKAQSSK